ncbi:MAG: DUF2207 domain-containing protein [Acidimicrobiia bacterium]|nr:DUF2207 domain-containing protein [Acidimicrobiia bacterium]
MALNVVIGLGIMAFGVVAWLVWNTVHRHRSSRGQELGDAGPATMELGAEPPAVVNLLVHRLELTDDALAATLLDLAARSHLEVIQVSPEHHLLRPRTRSGEAVTPYEGAVLAAVATATDPVEGTASVEALGRALGPGSVRTWAQFRTGVAADATSRGLVAQPSTASLGGPLMVLAGIVTVGFFVIVPPLWIVLPFLWVGLLLAGIIVAVRGRHLHLTDAGRAAGTRWLGVRRFLEDQGAFDDRDAGAVAVWDRYLAYATAFGLSDRAAHGVVRELRTSVSLADVGSAAAMLRAGYRAQTDPAAAREYAALLLAQHFGPDNPPDALLGPGGTDFYGLLSQTLKGMAVVTVLGRHEPARVWAVCERRLEELRASAPPELRADVDQLYAPAALFMQQALTPGQGQGMAALAADPAVRAAGENLLRAVATHLGCAPDAAAVSQALAARPS